MSNSTHKPDFSTQSSSENIKNNGFNRLYHKKGNKTKKEKENNTEKEKGTKTEKNTKNNKKFSDESTVTRLSIILVIIVFIIKVSVSFITRSLSFIVELSDSIIDLVAVSITFIALKESQKEPDFEHMFGHEKINSFAAFLQSLLILGLYGGLLFSTIKNWINGTLIETSNTLWGVGALVLIITLVFIVSHQIIQIGKKSKNQLILAQGTNFRGDFYRNITVIFSLTVSYFGIKYIDAIVAILFSLKAIYEGFQILSQSYKELIDTNPISKEQVEKLQKKLESLPGIREIQDLKIRTTGNKLDLSLCIKIKGKQRAFQIDLINERMRKIIEKEFPEYNCNTYFCTQSPKRHPHLTDIQWISNIIRKLAENNSFITNVHNIAIDQFQDDFLIQLQIDLPGSISLTEGHEIITQYEKDLRDIINQTLKQSTNIEIITHLEPTHEYERVHSHPVLEQAPENLKVEIEQLVKKFPDVKEIHDIRILTEPEGWFLSFMIHIDGKISIMRAHALNEQIEQVLFTHYPQLKDCTIHTEPYEND